MGIIEAGAQRRKIGYKMKFPTSVRTGWQRPGEVGCAAEHLGRSAQHGPPLTYLVWNHLTGPFRRGKLGRRSKTGWGLICPSRMQSTGRKA